MTHIGHNFLQKLRILTSFSGTKAPTTTSDPRDFRNFNQKPKAFASITSATAPRRPSFVNQGRTQNTVDPNDARLSRGPSLSALSQLTPSQLGLKLFSKTLVHNFFSKILTLKKPSQNSNSLKIETRPFVPKPSYLNEESGWKGVAQQSVRPDSSSFDNLDRYKN